MFVYVSINNLSVVLSHLPSEGFSHCNQYKAFVCFNATNTFVRSRDKFTSNEYSVLVNALHLEIIGEG